jgi:hypothetical protein
VLVTLVQSGAITIEGYVEGLRKAVDATREMAVKFKNAGNIEYARKCLKRMKLIQVEVSNMESTVES